MVCPTTQYLSVSFSKRVDPLLWLVGVQGEGHADVTEAHRGIGRETERSPEVQVTFGMHRATAKLELQRRRDSGQSDPGAGHQGFQQHVPRAGQTGSACRCGV